jgi:osmotically-inducible protein OsmY
MAEGEGGAIVNQSERSTDSSIQTSVQARLYADDNLRDEDIDVRADDGVVTLEGEVSSAAAKQQAVSVASGATDVTRVADQLTVASPSPGAQTAQAEQNSYRSAEANNPAWITTKIQAQYFVSPDIKPWNVDVTTNSAGVVELRGEVEDATAKAEAVRIARATEGVTNVEDHLRVRGETATSGDVEAAVEDLSDTWLTAKIQARYFLDDEVKARDIDVTTTDRVVSLSGTVGSEIERRQAVALARNTDGVRDVRDQLRVDAEASRAQGDIRGTTGRQIVAGIQDPWITTKIQSKYFLDADVKGHRIDVETQNGVVTLTGTVTSDARRDLAERIARETDGVNEVVNRLTVE